MIAIIDYDAGNLTSVARAVSYIGEQHCITKDPVQIRKADRVIFPGVGSAGSAMNSLEKYGLSHEIKKAFKDGKPLLGICLGSQIILEKSIENNTKCLGLIKGSVPVFSTDMRSSTGDALKIPHMGWNSVCVQIDHPVLSGISDKDEFYFVHGYYPKPESDEHVYATSEYGITFASIVGKGNLIATQFLSMCEILSAAPVERLIYLEKSGEAGLSLLKNFCRWEPC